MSEHRSLGRRLAASPLSQRLAWVVFAILFYQSGEAFTVWLLDRESFAGGMDWLWLAAFPVLLPGFFLVNRYLGCATGGCAEGRCELPPGREEEREQGFNWRSPGM